MVEKKTTTQTSRKDGKRDFSSVGGVVQFVGQSQFEQELLAVGKDFDEALGRCVIRDEWQRNAIILYKAQLEMFLMTREIMDLTSFLNASAAIGGHYNRELATMAHVGIYVPPLSNPKEREAYMKYQEMRSKSRGRDKEDESDKGRESP